MKLRFRHIAVRIPFLDKLRLATLAGICNHGSSFFDRSYSITRFIAPGAREYLESGKPAIFGFYHGRMVGLLQLAKPRKRLTVLVSLSRDGEMIARALGEMGFSLARGSPKKGAVEGALQLIKATECGQHLAVNVDGPMGPIYDIKPGIVRIAELSGVPIIPFVCSSRTSYWFWGWDRFMGPHWATPIAYMLGNPIFVQKDCGEAQREEYRVRLDEELTHLRQMADEYFDMDGGVDDAFAHNSPRGSNHLVLTDTAAGAKKSARQLVK